MTGTLFGAVGGVLVAFFSLTMLHLPGDQVLLGTTIGGIGGALVGTEITKEEDD